MFVLDFKWICSGAMFYLVINTDVSLVLNISCRKRNAGKGGIKWATASVSRGYHVRSWGPAVAVFARCSRLPRGLSSSPCGAAAPVARRPAYPRGTLHLGTVALRGRRYRSAPVEPCYCDGRLTWVCTTYTRNAQLIYTQFSQLTWFFSRINTPYTFLR